MLYVELGITWNVHRPNIYRQCPLQNSRLNQQISECGPPSLSSANLLRFYYKCRFSGSTWISWIRNPGGKTQQSVLTSLPRGSDTPKSESRWPALSWGVICWKQHPSAVKVLYSFGALLSITETPRCFLSICSLSGSLVQFHFCDVFIVGQCLFSCHGQKEGKW